MLILALAQAVLLILVKVNGIIWNVNGALEMLNDAGKQ